MANTLSDAFIKNITTPGRYTDRVTPGLNLQVKRNGGKYWTFRVVDAGRRRDVSLGAYPAVTLKTARTRAVSLRAQLYKGERLSVAWRPAHQTPARDDSKPIFADYAASCIEAKRPEWRNPKHAAQWSSTIERFANPVIGKMRIDEIGVDEILQILNPIWTTKTVTAQRLRGRIEWILASATTRGLRSGSNPAAWRGQLETILSRPSKVHREVHHPAMSYRDLPAFMAQLREMDGIAALALQFLILNASRTGEVIGGLHSEVSDMHVWTIPGHKMKAGKEHRVFLGERARELILMARDADPNSRYLFSVKCKPLSNMAMLALIKRMGQPFTVHGFRSTFRDWVAEETQYSAEVAEMALAHAIPNKTEAAYRRGDLFEPRKRLLSEWATFCLGGHRDGCE